MRIHYHSDCYWFSGSELALLIHLAAAFEPPVLDPVFTYRAWPEYEAGLRAQLTSRVRARRLRLPDPADLKQALSRGRSPRVASALRGGVRPAACSAGVPGLDVVRMYVEFRAATPDVVHINNGGFPGAISCTAAAIAARFAGVPVVVYVVNNIAFPYNLAESCSLDLPIDRLVVRSVGMLVTGSAGAGVALRSVLRLDPRQHRVIPNAVATHRARRDDGERESMPWVW